MAAFWRLDTEPRGLVLTVQATIEGTVEDGWRGEVTTVPFDALAAQGPGFGPVRDQLAAATLAEAAAGILPVPAQAIDAIRVMATSVTSYPRGGEYDGPLVSVPALADRDATTWCAVTAGAAGSLGGTIALGATVQAAQDALAEILMLAMDVGIDGIRETWCGIRLLTMTRKTYPTRLLSAR